jgi:hypothetical protein
MDGYSVNDLLLMFSFETRTLTLADTVVYEMAFIDENATAATT